MSSFYISIKKEILDKKHMDAMGSSIWLYMWLLDRMTVVDKETKVGKVLGGKPVRHEEFKDNLGLSRRTYIRYIQILEDAGYISTTRTPYGLVFYINKAEKLFGNPSKNTSKRYANIGTSDATKFGTSLTKNGTSLTKFGTSNKTSQLDKPIRQIGFKKSFNENAAKMPDLTGDFYERFDLRKRQQNA